MAAGLRGCRGVDELRASPAGRPSVQKETGCDGGPNRCSAVTLSSRRATVPGQPATLPPRRCYSPKKKKKKERRSGELAWPGRAASIKRGVAAMARSPSCSYRCPPRPEAASLHLLRQTGPRNAVLSGVSFVPTVPFLPGICQRQPCSETWQRAGMKHAHARRCGRRAKLSSKARGLLQHSGSGLCNTAIAPKRGIFLCK